MKITSGKLKKEFLNLENHLMVPSALRNFMSMFSNRSNENIDEALEHFSEIRPVLDNNVLRYIHHDMEQNFLARENQYLFSGLLKIINNSKVKKEEINQETIDFFVLQSFKYAVGRRTYIVSDALFWASCFSDYMSKEALTESISYIQDALDNDRAGDPCDVESWNETLKILKNKLKEANNARI